MLVILLPLDPSQCYLLKDVVKAVVPTFSTHCLPDHSYQHINMLQYLKWNQKTLAFPHTPLAITLFPCSPWHKTLQKNSLHLSYKCFSHSAFISFWKILSHDLFKYCCVLFSTFFFFWTPVTCTLNLSTRAGISSVSFTAVKSGPCRR